MAITSPNKCIDYRIVTEGDEIKKKKNVFSLRKMVFFFLFFCSFVIPSVKMLLKSFAYLGRDFIGVRFGAGFLCICSR